MESSTEPNIATQTVENRKLMLRLVALEDKASSSFCKIEKKMKKLKTNLQKVTDTVEDLIKQGELGTKQLTENMEQQFLIVKTHFREVVAYHSALESEVQHLKTMPPAVNIRYNESDNSDKIDEISKKLSELEVENSSLRLRIDELSEQLQEQLKSAGGFTEQEFFIQEFEHFKSKMEKLQRNKEKMNEKIKSCDGKIKKLTMNQNKFMKEMQENLCTRKKQSLDSSRLTLDVKEELEKRIVSLEDEKTKVRMLMKKTEEVNQKVDSIYANGLSTSNENSKNLEQDTLQKQMKELDKKVVELQLDFLKGKYVWSKVKLDEESIPTSADVFSAITDVSVKYEIMLAMLVKWLSQQEELKDFKANLNKQVNFLRIEVAKLKGSGQVTDSIISSFEDVSQQLKKTTGVFLNKDDRTLESRLMNKFLEQVPNMWKCQTCLGMSWTSSIKCYKCSALRGQGETNGSGSLASKSMKTTNKQPTKSSCGNQPTTMTHSTLPPSHGRRHSSASPAPGDSSSTTRGVAGPTSSHPGADPSQEVNSQTAPTSSSTGTSWSSPPLVSSVSSGHSPATWGLSTATWGHSPATPRWVNPFTNTTTEAPAFGVVKLASQNITSAAFGSATNTIATPSILNTTTSSLFGGATTTITTPSFSFNSATTTITTPSFSFNSATTNIPAPTLNTSAAFLFNSATTTTSLFGGTTTILTPSKFNTSSLFSGPTTTITTPSTLYSTTSLLFSGPTTTITTPSTLYSTTSSLFGSVTTTTPTPSTLYSTTSSRFGIVTTTTPTPSTLYSTTSSRFGIVTTPTPSTLYSTTSSLFGSATTTTPTPSTLYTTTSSLFGSATTTITSTLTTTTSSLFGGTTTTIPALAPSTPNTTSYRPVFVATESSSDEEDEAYISPAENVSYNSTSYEKEEISLLDSN